MEDLEKEDQKREDSNAGLRKEFADHRVDDATVAAELKGLIGVTDEKIDAVDKRIKEQFRWLLILIGLGLLSSLFSGITALVTHGSK